MSDILNFISKDSSISMTFEMYEVMLYRAKESERERILAMKKDIINCVIDYGLTPEKYERICNDIDALIKGEK